MGLKFSERKGFKAPPDVIQKDFMSEELRNSLWNVLDLIVWRSERFLWNQYGEPGLASFSRALWFQYFKKPIDSRPDHPHRILGEIRDYFFSCEWYEVYDFLEWVLAWASESSDAQKYQRLSVLLNAVLEQEFAGYRFVEDILTDIIDEKEIGALKEALDDPQFPGVRSHLQTAFHLLSDRENPDYRNSIKESISAVESLAKAITGKDKASLPDALVVLEKGGKLHSALKQAFVKFYAYTSDQGGIRHAMLEEPELNAADAKFFLLSCTSFINYLKSRL